MIQTIKNLIFIVDTLVPGNRIKIAGIIVLLIVNSVGEAIGVAMILPIIGLISQPDRVMAVSAFSDVYNYFGFSSINTFLLSIVALFFVFIVSKNAGYLLITVINNKFIYDNSSRSATKLLSLYMHSPLRFHLERNSSILITQIEGAVQAVYAGALQGYIGIISEGLMMLSIVTLLVIAEPLMTGSAAATFGIIFALLYFFIRRRSEQIGASILALHQKRLMCLQQALGGIKEVKIYGCENHFIEHFDAIVSKYGHNQMLAATIVQLPRLLVETLIIGGIVSVIAISLLGNYDSIEITSVLALFATASFRLMPSLNRVIMAVNSVKFNQQAVNSMAADIAMLRPEHDNQTSDLQPLHGQISLQSITFAYDPTREPVLRDIDLTIAKGEMIGFVSPSGAGKSTLIDIIIGLLAPDKGGVMVDGHHIATHIRAWQAQVGYVPQDVMIFDDTIRANVAFGLPAAVVDDNRIWQALAQARMDDAVRAMPGGLDARTGEGGAQLSGGQRQRLGLARALYRDAQVLVLDEATSGLDMSTESEISKTIEALRGDKTILIIAHRLNTVRSCDRIVVLGEGRIQATGSFDELWANNDHFRQLVELAQITPAPTPL